MTAIDLLRWLGETSLAVSLLVLLVLTIRKPFAKMFGARAAYALWLAPAIRLFLPELKLLTAPAAPAVDMATAPLAPPVGGWESQGAHIAAQAGEFAAVGFDWLSLAAAAALVLWATVAFAWFSLKLETQSKFMRARVANSKPASPQIMDAAKAIAEDFKLARTPSIRISNDNDNGPCLAGLLRPVIFLPAGFERDYAASEQRLVLAHEIAHLSRGDMIATLAALALQAAQWPNPLAHFSFTAFRTDQEAACDAFVLTRYARTSGAAGNYASAIVKSIRAETNAPAFGLALAHPIKERLMLLKSQKNNPARLLAGAAAVAMFTAVSLASTASYGFADAPKAEAAKETKKKSYGRTVISVDKGETLEIPGYDNARMIDVERKDGVRTVRVYGKNKKLLSENIYGPAQSMPYDEIVVVKNGERRTININGEDHPDHPAHPIAPVPPVPGAAYEVVIAGDHGDHDFSMAHCDGGDGAPMVMEWSDESDDGEKKFVTHQVLCMDDEETDPAKRAENLRTLIDRMEANAERDAERRKKMIADLRERLKEAEKEAR